MKKKCPHEHKYVHADIFYDPVHPEALVFLIKSSVLFKLSTGQKKVQKP